MRIGPPTPEPAGRRVYGIQEIAREVGVSPRLVATWRQRGSHGMPEPDEELAGGAVWLAGHIEPWITQMRERRSDDRPQQVASLLRVLARRTFRLAAVLNEEEGFRAGTIRFRTFELHSLKDDLAELVGQRTGQLGVSGVISKYLLPLPTLIEQAASLVKDIPRRLWQTRESTTLPAETEEDLIRLRILVGVEILPLVTEVVRQLEREIPRLRDS